MRVVVDSNIVFSALLNPQSSIGDILLNSQDTFTFISCEYLKLEIEEHKSKIVAATGYSEADYRELQLLVFQPVLFVSESALPFEFWQRAAVLIRDLDPDDIAFVAMSLFLDAPLWTGDKKLINGLLEKGFRNVVTTSEMLQIRRERLFE